MYSFTSSPDFNNKTGYVTDSFIPYDAFVSSGGTALLETPVMFCDLYDMYRSDIAAAHAAGTGFIGDTLCIGKFLQDYTVVGTYYVYIRLRVETNGTLHTQRVVTNTTPVQFPSGSYESTCTKEQYINGERQADNGKLYLMSMWGMDKDTHATLSEKSQIKYVWGQAGIYTGRWNPNYGTYGRMEYSFTGNYVLPPQFPLATVDQTGAVITNPDQRKNQPEITGSFYGSWSLNPEYDYKIGSYEDGSIDPDPDPPGPGPSDDPYHDPNDEPGDNPDPSPGGHVRDYDPVPIPPTPTVTSLGAGFTTLYVPTAAILGLLADEIFSDNILQIIDNIFSNPQDMIAGLSIVPFVVPVAGAYKHKVGLFESDVAMQKAASQFVDIDCGSITIEPYYNSFLDYSPITRLKLWLPYIGYQDIDADDVMGNTLSVKYRCDILSGACIAYVSTGTAAGSGAGIARVIAQYSGNCSVQVPTGAQSYDNMISTAINILTTAGGTLAGGGGLAAATSGAASSAANNITAMKPDVKRNGTPGSTSGYLGVQKPYLIRITPRSSVPDNFKRLHGYASNRSGLLGGFLGYCEVADIRLQNVPATEGETKEILDLLKGGVII